MPKQSKHKLIKALTSLRTVLIREELPVFEGLRPGPELSLMAFARPRARIPLRVRGNPAVRRFGLPDQGFGLGLVLDLPHLFRLATAPAPYRAVGTALLRTYADYVGQLDWLLGEHAADRIELPDEVLYQHLARLTESPTFRRTVSRSLRRVLRPLIDYYGQRGAGQCRHGQDWLHCEGCRPYRWVSNEGAVIGVSALFAADLRKHPAPRLNHLPCFYTAGANLWTQELRYLVSALLPVEGVLRLDTERLLVNLPQVQEFFRRIGASSRYEAVPKDGFHSQRLRELFEQQGSAFVIETPPEKLRYLIPFEWAETPAPGLLVLSRPRIGEYLARANQLTAAGRRFRRAKRPVAARPYRNRVITLQYQGTPIQVLRHTGENYFTLPESADWDSRYSRKGSVLRRGALEFWSVRGLNTLSHRAEWAQDFRRWADIEDHRLTAAEFRRQHRDQTKDTRYAEMLGHRRHHLGPYTPTEDAQLTAFMQAWWAQRRVENPRRPRRRLNAAERRQLEDVVPGRRQDSLLRRLLWLARLEVEKRGISVTLQSGFVAVMTPAQVKKWRREGLPA